MKLLVNMHVHSPNAVLFLAHLQSLLESSVCKNNTCDCAIRERSSKFIKLTKNWIKPH